LVFVFIFCIVFLAAVVFGSNDGSEEKLEMLKDFYYEGNTALPYQEKYKNANNTSP